MRIVSRREWGARHDNGDRPAPLPAELLYLHHSTTPASNGAQAIRNLEAIGEARFKHGISYTFAVTVDGTTYEGHSIDRRGTHTGGLNSTARAICAVGNFQTTDPTAQLLEAIAQLVAHGHRQGWWPDRITGGHRDAPKASTACPGDRLHRQIPALNRRIAELLTEDDMTPDQARKLDEIHAALFDGVPSFGVPPIREAVTETAYHVQGYDLPDKPSLLKQILTKLK